MNSVVQERTSQTSRIFPSPADYPNSPLSNVLQQPLILGLFLPIHAGGWSSSTLPRSTTWTFDYNKALTLKAEELGFDLVFGVANWSKKGGAGGQRTGEGLDSFIATASLAAVTKKILLISTLHVLYGPWHPLHLAKFGATLDHISGGRWGINVVTGHRASEHEMFGWNRIEHDHRYELAEEFVEVLQRLWIETENLSYEGLSSWKLKDAYVTPRPLYGRPILVNATGSDAGIAYAGRYSDIVFITSPTGSQIEDALSSLPAHTARVKQSATNFGRSIRTLLNPTIICRETEKEAWEYHDAIVDHIDRDAIKGFQRTDSDAHAWKGRIGRETDASRAVGGNVQIVGTPEQIVDYFRRLKAAGVDGVQLTFYDFEPDLAFFGERVLPLLKEAGLRL